MASGNRKRTSLVAAGLLLVGLSGPAGLGAAPSTAALRDEAGFIDLEPVTFHLQYGSFFHRWTLKSSEASLWYSFHAADADPASKPLFVFFNGGPGSATSHGLLSMYTSEYTLDNRIDGGGDAYIVNPVPWTRLGNLLHIDARQAGFSYNRMDDVQNMTSRFLEFNVQNFNPFIDGADFVRVLLRFLSRHPEIQANRVVIVGESYGGVRSIVMLHLLLNYRDYGNNVEMYQDPALAAEIQAHYDVVFPEYRGQEVPPEAVVRQFGHQILIQPAITMNYQSEIAPGLMLEPGSVIDQLVQQTGIPYSPSAHGTPTDYVRNVARRDLYIYTKPDNWLNSFFGKGFALLQDIGNLSMVTGFDVTTVTSLYAAARTRAYRVFDVNYGTNAALHLPARGISAEDDFLFLEPARLEASSAVRPTGNLPSVFGALQPWDAYFIGTNYHANWAATFFNAGKARGYETYYGFPRFGRMFLKNVAYVHTFVTNAGRDLVVFSRAIPPALARHADVVQSVRHVLASTGEARPGKIVLQYLPSAFPDLPEIGERTIRFPLYAGSCHAVSLTQPLDLYQDVVAWLAEKGLRLD